MKLVALSVIVGVLLGTSIAAADDTVTPQAAPTRVSAKKAAQARTRGVENLDPIVIPGKLQKPLVSINIERVPLETTLAQLRQPLVDRIAKASEKDPF
jgi:hypothetical protein